MWLNILNSHVIYDMSGQGHKCTLRCHFSRDSKQSTNFVLYDPDFKLSPWYKWLILVFGLLPNMLCLLANIS
jgi:hypothetical protein